MGYRHIDEIDRAVGVARRALRVGHLRAPEHLSRFLYLRWYLGLPSHQAGVPARRPQLWQAWSESWTDGYAGSRLVRLHLSCAPHTSLHAIGAVCARARQWDVPWRLTSTAVGTAVPTNDATVLYLPLEHLDALRRELAILVQDLQPFLGGAVPALTLRIGRGASLAQNPPDDRSFGEHRCGLLARSVTEDRCASHREQVQRAMCAFDEAGIDPRRPYLEKAGAWDRPWV